MEKMNVRHKVFGTGVVTSIDGNRITVDFNGIEKEFPYPKAFGGFLTAEDSGIQKRLFKLSQETACYYICGQLDGDEEPCKDNDPIRMFLHPDDAFKDLKRRLHEFYEFSKSWTRIANYPDESAFYHTGSEDMEKTTPLFHDDDLEGDDFVRLMDEVIKEGAISWRFYNNENGLNVSYYFPGMENSDEPPYHTLYVKPVLKQKSELDIDYLLNNVQHSREKPERAGKLLSVEAWEKWLEENEGL